MRRLVRGVSESFLLRGNDGGERSLLIRHTRTYESLRLSCPRMWESSPDREHVPLGPNYQLTPYQLRFPLSRERRKKGIRPNDEMARHLVGPNDEGPCHLVEPWYACTR